MNNRNKTDVSACVHCHVCRKHCVFLEKYKLDIGDSEQLEKLAYHCFLCGKCSEVCPKGIDGREIILQMRQKKVRQAGKTPREKGYGMLLLEKKNYLFSNYRNMSGKSVLFPGCNFPSFYPETTIYLAQLLKQSFGIGTVFDCCGKPISELGMKEQEETILGRIEEKFVRAGVEEVILLCPNCYAFLKPRLSIRVVHIYEKLRELGIGGNIEEDVLLFLPCPDRERQEMLADIGYFLKKKPRIIQNVQCCGLGGCAGGKEPDLARQMADRLEVDKQEMLYTYCASCAGNFTRKGYQNTEHILLKILGVTESVDAKKSLWNRMRMKYWRGKTNE